MTYREQAQAPPKEVFEAQAINGEVIEVRKCLSRVVVAPGEVYRSTVQNGERDFLLFWADDIKAAVERAIEIVGKRADQEANS